MHNLRRATKSSYRYFIWYDTRFPFGIVVDLKSRGCRKLKRENTAGVRSSYQLLVYPPGKNEEHKKTLESYEYVNKQYLATGQVTGQATGPNEFVVSSMIMA